MAGEDDAYDAAFERAGHRPRGPDRGRLRHGRAAGAPAATGGPRLAIVTNAGGPGVMAADALLARGGVLAELAGHDAVLTRPRRPRRPANPVDVLGDAPARALRLAVASGCSRTPARTPCW